MEKIFLMFAIAIIAANNITQRSQNKPFAYKSITNNKVDEKYKNDSTYVQKIIQYFKSGYIKSKETWEQVKPKLQKIWGDSKRISKKEWERIKMTWAYYRKLH